MRRFSQKNALVTLADINVTPLLDLAFVLLIIFVITTPLLEQSMTLDLPSGGRPEQAPLDRRDIQTVEVGPDGSYRLEGNPQTLPEIERLLVGEYQRNPKMVVAVRGDRRASWEAVAELLDVCQRNEITRIDTRMSVK